jgi:hypothetical protein
VESAQPQRVDRPDSQSRQYTEFDNTGLTSDGILDSEKGTLTGGAIRARWQGALFWQSSREAYLQAEYRQHSGNTSYQGYLQTGLTLTPYSATTHNELHDFRARIQVALLAANYQCQSFKEETLVPVQPTFQEILADSLVKSPVPSQYFEKNTTPALKVSPERLRFTFKLNNKLQRVFRGAGAVIQFNIAGKTQRVDQSDYKELIEMIVPPRNEQQVDFWGPGIDQVPDQSTIGIFLYDVVTKTDAAGNTLEKQNFEWYFKYSRELREETREIVKERVKLDPRTVDPRMIRR